MAHNPDHYTQGTRVKLSAEARKQGLGKPSAIGTVTSRYPNEQCVYVEWDGKHSKSQWHVDLLDIAHD